MGAQHENLTNFDPSKPTTARTETNDKILTHSTSILIMNIIWT